jgi:hypothetical protein
MTRPVIELRAASKVYGSGDTVVRAVDRVDLVVERGDYVAVMGASGSGKSTLMNIIGCLDAPTSGRYLLDGVDVRRLDDRRQAAIRNRKIGFVFQFFNLLPKGLDSCAPRKLLREVKEKSPTGMLFSYISPDYASGFLLLSTVREFLYLDEPLVYIPNNWMWKGKYSNGQASYRKTETYKKFLDSLPVTRNDILKNVPVKSEFLWINSVLYDFFTFYKRPLHQPKIHWPSYYGFCIYLIFLGWKLGADLSDEIRELRRAVSKESPRLKLATIWDVFRRCLILSGGTLRRRLLR